MTQLTGALGGLTGGELTGVLGGLTGGELTGLLGGLTGAQISGLLAALLGGKPAAGLPAVTPGLLTTIKLPGKNTTTVLTPASTAYRATISKVTTAKSRKSARVTVRCPASAPKGCLVQVAGKVADRRAFSTKNVLLLRGTSKTITAKLTKTAAKRLKARGGSLRLTASTVQSSLGSASKTVKVKAPRKRR